jgi:hypothetical protein
MRSTRRQASRVTQYSHAISSFLPRDRDHTGAADPAGRQKTPAAHGLENASLAGARRSTRRYPDIENVLVLFRHRSKIAFLGSESVAGERKGCQTWKTSQRRGAGTQPTTPAPWFTLERILQSERKPEEAVDGEGSRWMQWTTFWHDSNWRLCGRLSSDRKTGKRILAIVPEELGQLEIWINFDFTHAEAKLCLKKTDKWINTKLRKIFAKSQSNPVIHKLRNSKIWNVRRKMQRKMQFAQKSTDCWTLKKSQKKQTKKKPRKKMQISGREGSNIPRGQRRG